MNDILDIHTHTPRHGAIYNATPGEIVDKDTLYSVGIHPWYSDNVSDKQWQQLTAMTQTPNCVAIGEAGLDALRGPGIDQQIDVFEKQILLSIQLNKPLIVHCVRQYDNLLQLFKKYRPRQPWIVHGFRGKPQLAHQLLDAGLYLSIGQKFNKDTLDMIPSEKMLIETDDATVDIHTIAQNVGVEPEVIHQNIRRIFESVRYKD